VIDFVKEFPKYEKQIAKYIRERVDTYFKSHCRARLITKINRLDSSWNLEVSGSRKNEKKNTAQSHFLAQLTYPLVKEQMLVRRSVFSSNFRSDPLFSIRPVGNTPMENAINMQDLLESNNQSTKFRPLVLIPSINAVSRWGTSVIFTEYLEDTKEAWRTIADPIYGAKRVFGPVKNTKNAVSYNLDLRNYFQNPSIADCDASDYRGHLERWSMSKLVQRVKANEGFYIKENVDKIIGQLRAKHFNKDQYYTDPQGRESLSDYGAVAISDVVRGQFQIDLEGNQDDATTYYVEMIGDTIIRFQDNPYDLDMNQYTVLTCEPRMEYFWGDTPAEYSVQNENALNLLNGLGIDNAIESMKNYIFYNKNAIDPGIMNRASHNARIPVNVANDVALTNILFRYQPQDTAGPALEQAYRRIMENNQRVVSTPDLSRAPSSGGPSNKTAYAADIMASVGNTLDADILEKYSHCLGKVGEKGVTILAQFLGNMGPIMITPENIERAREVQKQNITGNYSLYFDTALQRSYTGEISRYQNIITWLLNTATAAPQLQPDVLPLVKQVLKMGKFIDIDRVIPEQQAIQQQPGFQPTDVMPGQELAGAGQEMPEMVMQ
jgi:hypothetical protein